MNVLHVYQKLLAKYGPQNWWPIYCLDPDLRKFRLQHGLTYGIPYKSLTKFYNNFRDPYFEIAIGAILAQNVSWSNAAKAIQSLFELKALRPEKILELSNPTLLKALIPTRYYAQKAKKLISFSEWLMHEFNGDILKLKELPLDEIRLKLLDQWGIGKETADSIMLYALNLPIFVIDTYTKRFCAEQKVIFDEYDEYRKFFEKKLKRAFTQQEQIKVYQEFHALFVAAGQKNKNERITTSPLVRQNKAVSAKK